jgi:hypothetical protein
MVRILVTFGVMIRTIIFFLLVFTANLSINAQTAADSIQKGVEADPRLQTLVTKHMEVNSHEKGKGYRVQIYFGADKAKANAAKAQFLSRGSDATHAYELYDVPNFKIRVGDFRTKMDAYRYLKKIKGEFPQAFIVESEIEFPEQ